jgi:hypothetical protein
MNRSNPVKALNGVRIGHICDRCNKGVRTGDLVRAYATHYDRDGWVLRRVWCEECGDSTLEEGTDGADEVIVEAVFWEHRLVSVEERDGSWA